MGKIFTIKLINFAHTFKFLYTQNADCVRKRVLVGFDFPSSKVTGFKRNSFRYLAIHNVKCDYVNESGDWTGSLYR